MERRSSAGGRPPAGVGRSGENDALSRLMQRRKAAGTAEVPESPRRGAAPAPTRPARATEPLPPEDDFEESAPPPAKARGGSLRDRVSLQVNEPKGRDRKIDIFDAFRSKEAGARDAGGRKPATRPNRPAPADEEDGDFLSAFGQEDQEAAPPPRGRRPASDSGGDWPTSARHNRSSDAFDDFDEEEDVSPRRSAAAGRKPAPKSFVEAFSDDVEDDEAEDSFEDDAPRGKQRGRGRAAAGATRRSVLDGSSGGLKTAFQASPLGVGLIVLVAFLLGLLIGMFVLGGGGSRVAAVDPPPLSPTQTQAQEQLAAAQAAANAPGGARLMTPLEREALDALQRVATAQGWTEDYRRVEIRLPMSEIKGEGGKPTHRQIDGFALAKWPGGNCTRQAFTWIQAYQGNAFTGPLTLQNAGEQVEISCLSL